MNIITKNMYRLLFFFFFPIVFLSCSKKYVNPTGKYESRVSPTAPDYTQMKYWAAHPDKKDMADRIPGNQFPDNQSTSEIDVFFLYPTVYVGERKQDNWNAPVDDPEFNAEVDKTTILNQASIFNGAGRVFSPRYRQAHLHAYYTSDKEAHKKAFALAYSDVKAAFEYYLEHHNNGRPIIIASHSQGTTHAGPLMREFFDGKPLQEKLVAAYVVGIEVPRDYFNSIQACETPIQTGCFCSWRTWEKGYLPPNHDPNNNYVVTNPLTWKTDTEYAPKELNKGSVLYKFDKIKPALSDAQVHQGVLWVTKPKFFGSAFIKMKNYHIADYNLYYVNVRDNAILRSKEYLKKMNR